jgi:hypothetical protein
MVSTLSTCVLLLAGGHYFDSLLFLFSSRYFLLFLKNLFFETIETSVFQCHKHTMLSGTQKETLALPWMLCI